MFDKQIFKSSSTATTATVVAAAGVVRKPRRGGTISGGRFVRGRYDLAQTTDNNRKHWAAADSLSAEAANTRGIRTIIRNRTRYEVGNSSYLKGMIGTLQNDTVGRGPRLQMLLKNPTQNSTIEYDWCEWAKKVKLAKKIRQLRRARLESGEAFAIQFTNPKLPTLVKLDIMTVECDRVTDLGFENATDPLWCDGIRYDEFQNPVSYRVLKYHPGGGAGVWFGPNAFDDYPADLVFHYFKDDERPGQRRGIPELQPSVNTGAVMRRYDDATLRTAEVQARIPMVLETDVAPEIAEGAADPETPETMDAVELPESGAVVLPPNYKLNGLQTTQPADKHIDFIDSKIRETARCIQMPFTVAALDSSKANMSARYMDAQIYASSIKVDRVDLEQDFLDWIFEAWAKEYWLVKPNMPRNLDGYPHTWYWPSLNQHADPSKVANATTERLNTGTSCLSDEAAEDGADIEELMEKEARVLGVTIDQLRALMRLKRFGTADPDGKPMTTPAPAGAEAPPKNGSRQPMPMPNGPRNGNRMPMPMEDPEEPVDPNAEDN